MIPFRLVRAGDSALLVEFEERIDPVINGRAVTVAKALQAAAPAGVMASRNGRAIVAPIPRRTVRRERW